MEDAVKKHGFKRTIEELRKCRGQHTELISLYIPPNRQISDVVAYLRNEYSQSSNIKSKTTRKNVMAAIESILAKLKYFKAPPPNGIVFFVGHKSAGADKTEMVSYILEPPEPINTYTYRCDSTFFLEPLEQLVAEKERYGLLLVDRREATIGVLSGKNIQAIENMQSLVPSKHRMGGQSARRFERIVEEAAHDWFVKVGQVASQIFLMEPDLKGILVGGPGPTKDYFVKENFLDYRVQQKIAGQYDTGYTDEYGLRELVDKASLELTSLALGRERDIGQRFMREIVKPDGGLSVYGEAEVRRALEMNALDTLLLSDALRLYRAKIGCQCGYSEEKTIKEEDLEKDWGICPKCGAHLQVLEKKDIIQDLSELAEKGGARIELLSTETNEGETLFKAFGGIAGILRYRI